MKKTIVSLFSAVVLGLATTANAIPTGDGATIDIGSWMLNNVIESGVGNFTMMEAFITSGNSTFDGTGWGSLDGGWTSRLTNPTYAKASGSALTQQWLHNMFASAVGTMVVWDILACNGTAQVDAFRMWSNGTG
jgi:hypothetical protein